MDIVLSSKGGAMDYGRAEHYIKTEAVHDASKLDLAFIALDITLGIALSKDFDDTRPQLGSQCRLIEIEMAPVENGKLICFNASLEKCSSSACHQLPSASGMIWRKSLAARSRSPSATSKHSLATSCT
jgi:hypothetical protein